MRRLLQRVALYTFHLCIARPVLKWAVGVRYRRRHVVPQGPCLVVSNHNSHLDAAVLMAMFPLRRVAHVHPVAAADYFGSNWFMRMIAMACMNGIPIERRPAPGQDPLSPIAEYLKDGESLIFFPEGSRGEAGVVSRFRPGVGRLVQSVPGLLVVPVFLSGPERIWPRGNVVPVPFSIDANVGRPRTYPATDDARAIAEQVQEDVLALAPPPPPVPGPPPAPPLRVAICSVDAELRVEVFRRVTERLGLLGRTIGIADPLLEGDAEGVREATGPLPVGWSRAWLGLLAGIFRTSGRFKGDRFVEMVEKSWVNEALDHGDDTRFVVADGSALVDLTAWAVADFYRGVFDESGLNHLMRYLEGQKRIPVGSWWKFIRRAPEVWLISVFNLARPPIPDVLVHLEQPIPAVMQRLRSEGAELGPYDNEGFLERLQEGHRQVAAVLRKRRKVEVLEPGPSELRPDEVAARVEAVCHGRLARSRKASPAP